MKKIKSCLFTLLLLVLECCLVCGQQQPSESSNTYLCGSDDWKWHQFGDGNMFAYKALDMPRTSYWEGYQKCLSSGARPVSMHSQEENELVRAMVADKLPDDGVIKQPQKSFWIGLHRVQMAPPNGTVVCFWDDGTPCDWGNVTNSAVNIADGHVGYPWGVAQPSGTGLWTPCQGGTALCLESCGHMYNKKGHWNDVTCNFQTNGIVCKKACSIATAAATTTTATTAGSTATTTAADVDAQIQ